MRKLQAESAARHGVLVESLAGVETVRATGAEARMQNAWERSVAATARSGEEVHHWSSLALTSASTAQQLNYLLMVIVGVFLILDGKITVGVLVASTMLSGRVLAPITGIATVITRAAQTFVTLKAINRIMHLERERPPERIYVARRIEKGSVAFENVSFSYPGSNEAALEKVSFKIAGGERVGIIGRVGSGKTTVGRLLSGFYEPTEGKVLVDDVDARQYDPADLRTGVGFVLQDTDLFFGKIRDNIALGKPTATDEEIIAAARLAGVENFIAGHPLGYDMPIAEGGRSLSGGQKQAIGLARALIRRPKVAVPRRADRAFRRAQRGRVPRAAQGYRRRQHDHPDLDAPPVAALLRRPHPAVRARQAHRRRPARQGDRDAARRPHQGPRAGDGGSKRSEDRCVNLISPSPTRSAPRPSCARRAPRACCSAPSSCC